MVDTEYRYRPRGTVRYCNSSNSHGKHSRKTMAESAVGAAAMLSRAQAGLVGQTLLFTMPGSPGAVRLAMEKLVIPELGHLLQESQR